MWKMLCGFFCGRYFLSKQNFYAVHDKYKVFYSIDEWKYDVTNIIIYSNNIRVRSVTLSIYLGHTLGFENFSYDIDISQPNKKFQ